MLHACVCGACPRQPSTMTAVACTAHLQNILLTRDLRAKLSDVGLAQLLAGQPYTRDDCRGTWAWAGQPRLFLSSILLPAL